MPKITIPAELARDILWDDSEDGECVEDEIVGNSRWSIQHRAILKYKDKFYRAYYQVGAAESQEEQAWEYDDTVELVEVHQVPKSIMVWDRV